MKNFLNFLIYMFCGTIVYFLALILLIAIFFGVCWGIGSFFPYKANYESYLDTKFKDHERNFVSRSFQKIPIASKGQVVLIMGAEWAPYSDRKLPVAKNYDIIAFDDQRFSSDVIVPESENSTRIIYNWSADLPDLDIVMASFVFESYYSKGLNLFEKLWHYIDSKIKPGGYFIGNFFDPDCKIFDEEFSKGMSFLTKDEVLFLFRNYDIINFEEVKKPLKINKKEIVEHYYEVFARKK